MGALHEVLRHLVHSGPARNPGELEHLLALVDADEAAQDRPGPSQAPAQAADPSAPAQAPTPAPDTGPPVSAPGAFGGSS